MTGYKLKDLIERPPSLDLIKNEMHQLVAGLENILFHLDLVIKILRCCKITTPDICERDD